MIFVNRKTPDSYLLINTVKRLSWLRSVLLESEEFAFDIETNYPTNKGGRVPEMFYERICGISFAWGRKPQKTFKPGNAAYIPLGRADDSNYWGTKHEVVMETIKEILESPVAKVAQNGKFDVRKLYTLEKIQVMNFTFDTMLACGLLDEGRDFSSHSLKSEFDSSGKVIKLGMADAYLDLSASQFKDDLASALLFYDEKFKRYSKVPLEILYPYGCADADFTLALKYVFLPRLEEEGLRWLFDTLIMPLQHELTLMELHGIPVEIPTALRVQAEQAQLSEQLTKNIYAMCGKVFNVSSDKQLGEALFESMQLEGGYKNENGQWVTDADVLKSLKHPVAEQILQYKRSQHILNAYVTPILDSVVETEEDGRIGWIHSNFYMNTVTGRLTMGEPTLNVLPRPENGGLIVKSLFAGGADYRFIFMDFSQVELRVIAHLSQEPVWVEGFRNGYDMHAAMAQRIWHPDLSVSDVKKLHPDSRSKAKAVNFGIAYGMTPASLAERLKMSVEAADHLVNVEYYGAAPQLKKWIDSVHNFASQNGYVYSLFGRRRHLPDAALFIPRGPQWPHEPRECYRQGPNLDGIDLPYEDIFTITDVDLKLRIRKAGHVFLQKCVDCKQLRSCIAHREVKRLKGAKQRALRQAVNAPVQSSAVDVTSLCLVLINNELRRRKLDAMLVMHTHDELQAYAHVSCVEEVSAIMKYYMTDYMASFLKFSVPLKVDAVVAHRWSEKYDEE